MAAGLSPASDSQVIAAAAAAVTQQLRAKMKSASAKAHSLMKQAVAGLLFDQGFFAVLVLRLDIVEDWSCDTAWTDGEKIGYNPFFIASLPLSEVQGVLCHEVLHVANGHTWRREQRDPEQWNVACDYAINPIVFGSGMHLPKGALLDQQYDGLAAEVIYPRLPKKSSPKRGGQAGAAQQQAGGGTGNDAGDDAGDGEGRGSSQSDQAGSAYGPDNPNPGKPKSPGMLGEVRDYPDPTQVAQAQAQWQQAVHEAARSARMKGELPAMLDRMVTEVTRSRVDWKSVLWRFVQQAAADDYSWRRPNRRYIGTGLYLPALRSERMGPIVVAIDTSGSISGPILNAFSAETDAVVLSVKPEKTYVVYCDAKVHSVDEFDAGDPVVLHPQGGGGTSFRPVFEWVQRQGIEPTCLIYLTDMLGDFPSEAPPYPVLWASILPDRQGPFGDTVFVDIEDA